MLACKYTFDNEDLLKRNVFFMMSMKNVWWKDWEQLFCKGALET